MECWFERLARFEHAAGDLDKFTRHGADDDHLWFATGQQTVAIAFAPLGLLIEGQHGRHVQRLPQQRMVDLGQAVGK